MLKGTKQVFVQFMCRPDTVEKNSNISFRFSIISPLAVAMKIVLSAYCSAITACLTLGG
jgi:hypothetical protein